MEHVIYYSDELHDDFAGTNIDTKPLPEDYVYIDRSPLYRVSAFIVYRLLARPLVWLYCKLGFLHVFRNRSVLRASRGRGAYFIGNHTNAGLDSFVPNIIRPGKLNYIIAGPDAMSLTAIRTLLKQLGVIPIGSTLEQAREMSECVSERVSEGASVTVYPEAHIWPYYTRIRPFPPGAFRFAAKDGEAVYTLTTCYKRRLIGSMPRAVTYVDGPFYADMSLPLKKRMEKLCLECRETMEHRAAEQSDYEYVRYIRKDKSAEDLSFSH